MIDQQMIEGIGKFTRDMDQRIKSLREMRDVYNERIAFDFCFMNQFFHPDERKISQILAFFLDPKEKHAQGNNFLREFLLYFGLCGDTSMDIDLEGSSVKLEYPTEHGRLIDIVIRLRSGFHVGIENKLDAGDQPRQLFDYASDLEKCSAGNYRLLYLTPDRREPSQSSITDEERENLGEKLQCIGYKDGIIGPHGLLVKFESVCRADNVRAFIRDFEQYIRLHYVGEYDMGEDDLIRRLVKDEPSVLRCFNELEQAIEGIREEYIGKLWGKVAHLASQEGLRVQKFMPQRGVKGDRVSVIAQIGGDNADKFCVAYDQRASAMFMCVQGLGNNADYEKRISDELRLRKLEVKAPLPRWSGWRPRVDIACPFSNDALAELIGGSGDMDIVAHGIVETIKQYIASTRAAVVAPVQRST